MFQSARIKLTVFYLLIIMLVSVFFSLVIYAVNNEEYNRIEHFQKLRQEREQQRFNSSFEEFRRLREQQGLHVPPLPDSIDPTIIAEARSRLQIILILVNLTILGVAGLAGYFLAGRTLQPIKEMVDEQNRFITDASHELRTPITSLKTSTEVYLRDNTHNLEEADELHKSNLEEINNLQLMSDNLIKLTQYQKSNGNIAFENISLKEIILEAEKKIANLAKHKHITITNHLKDNKLKGNKHSLIELFAIFLDNAIKYSHQKTAITISSELTDHHIKVSIKDQGIGIDPEDIPHLFERFYRTDKSRTKIDVSGYGLGLSIAKQIIDKHNGFVKVESSIGKGTTFLIYLPQKH